MTKQDLLRKKRLMQTAYELQLERDKREKREMRWAIVLVVVVAAIIFMLCSGCATAQPAMPDAMLPTCGQVGCPASFECSSDDPSVCWCTIGDQDIACRRLPKCSDLGCNSSFCVHCETTCNNEACYVQ